MNTFPMANCTAVMKLEQVMFMALCSIVISRWCNKGVFF
jgi:hypothetical protein